MKHKRELYVTPELEFVEFTAEESIATSMDAGPGTICGEELKEG